MGARQNTHFFHCRLCPSTRAAAVLVQVRTVPRNGKNHNGYAAGNHVLAAGSGVARACRLKS